VSVLAGSAAAQDLGQGFALFEYWLGISGTSVDADLRTDPNFPDRPDLSEWRTSLQGPVDWMDNYGVRARAYLTPPADGAYTFWVSGDDNCQLWLSTNDDPQNAVMIAQVPGWTNPEEWTKYPEQQSPPVPLQGGQSYYVEMLMKEGGGGDSIAAAWAGPEIGETPTVISGEYLVAFIRNPEPLFQAQNPNPAKGATGVSNQPALSWEAGIGAVQHDLFLSTDPNAVAAADPNAFQGRRAETMFTPAEPLLWDTTYYWRVDEIDPNDNIVPGVTWSFTVADFLVIRNEQMALPYDNTREPFLTEIALDVPADWTINDVNELVLEFLGRRGPVGSFTHDDVNDAYVVRGAGVDIWSTADEFEYVYSFLNGDGSITARVESLEMANDWSKAGVMIRESLGAGSQHAFVAITPSNGVAFQNRVETDQISYNSNVGGIAAPHWVRLVREGNLFSGYHSADGATWELLPASGETPNPREIPMETAVLIGLAVTSHVDAQTTAAAVFNDVNTTGDVMPALPLQFGHDIPTNDPQPVYVRIEDASGATASVTFPDPAATQITDWWTWRIPLGEFTDVNVASVAKLYLGVGDPDNPQPDGSGVVLFNNLRVVRPTVIAEPNDVTSPGDNVQGVPNDGDWPAAETPPNAIDNDVNTKYLHFKGETEPTGFRVEIASPAIVTGATFTTANDAPERDPIQFEIYGATESLDGPYTLIMACNITDFAGATPWPRFTRNATPITFENAVPYRYYQVLFPAVRDPASANSMQIAEVELIGTTAQ